MSKPFQYRGKWTIRWTDESGSRRKQSFDKYADAEHALAVERARVKEVKKGLRAPTPPDESFNELGGLLDRLPRAPEAQEVEPRGGEALGSG
jgi:hypothetical protein